MVGKWIEIDLDEFTDQEIEDEYNERKLNNAGWDDHEMLTRIWIADREGRKDEAYTLMREYVLEKLNKVI